MSAPPNGPPKPIDPTRMPRPAAFDSNTRAAKIGSSAMCSGIMNMGEIRLITSVIRACGLVSAKA